ncbi:MAG: acyl-CoA thioesterase [Chloroflexi bacterium]|nr:acyl-CoA thioesterase [Chloroflexota bacterium]
MPLTYTRTFDVRSYECDAYGHLNHANYLRYMQEAAIEASARIGYDMARYEQLGTVWLAHETDIEYLGSVMYGDTVEIATWVGDFGHTRSRRHYECRSISTGDLVARAYTDWVYIDRTTQRPTSIPAEMVSAFLPDGETTPAPKHNDPPVPPPPPSVFTMERRVEWRDIDQNAHVNNATYLNYLADCGFAANAAVGWSATRTTSAGYAFMARRHHIVYQQPAVLDDVLRMESYVSDLRRSSARRYYTITRARDNTPIARAFTLWMFVSLTTGRLTRMPPEIQADFAATIVEPEA